MDGPASAVGVFAFDQFRLDPVARSLTSDGVSVKLPARLFDTLLYLVEHHDRLVERDELLRAVWTARTVDSTSLGMAISSLRAVLKSHGAADTLIVTAPGRGYRFGARVSMVPMPLHTASDGGFGAISVLPARLPTSGWRRKSVVMGLALAVCAAGMLAWRASAPWLGMLPDTMAHMPPPPHSVAVLPFENMSGDPREAYFADGLSEELTDALSRVGALHVAAQVSSFSFRGSPAAIADIGRQLNVGTILAGSVRREGGRVRVAVRLIDATSGFQIWSRSYDRDQGDILSLERQIAEAAIASLKIVLLGDAAARLTPGGTKIGGALDAYLAGLRDISDEDTDADRRAVAAFDTAIGLDSSYALAYAARARALTFIAANAVSSDVAGIRKLLEDALRDAEKSVALAPDLGEAHAALGFVLKSRLTDLARAGAEYARAVELSPGDASILMRYALFQVALGHKQDAVDAAEHAASLDPLTPKTYRHLSRVLAFAGRYDDAMTSLRRAQHLAPPDPTADRQFLSFLEMSRGDASAAARTCGAALDTRDDLCLAWAYHRLGRLLDAQNELAKVRGAVGDNAAFIFALIHADWGDRDAALRWLETAYRLRDPGLIEMQVVPFPQWIRDAPLYRDIVRELGFPP